MSDFQYALRERRGSIVTEARVGKRRRMAAAGVLSVNTGCLILKLLKYMSGTEKLYSDKSYLCIASHGRFSTCSSVVYVKYTPSSQIENHSVICDPGVNICF